jgi:hypothetical protein
MNCREKVNSLVQSRLEAKKEPPPPHVKAAYDALDAEHKAAGAALRAIPGVGSGSTGLTPDHIKNSSEYKTARGRADRAFQAVRNFNSQFASKYDWRKQR